MNDTLRSLVAGATGAILVSAVLIGGPSVADQVEKAKAKKVTSAKIKDGTIKKVDLNAEVSGPLAKADTALQGIADNSITNPKLADNAVTNPELADNAVGSAEVAANSLTAGDLAADSVGTSELAGGSVGILSLSRGGTANVVVPALANNVCANVNIDIGDFTFGFMPIVTPGLTAEPGLFVEGARIADADEILVRVCNRSGGAYVSDTEPFLYGALI